MQRLAQHDHHAVAGGTTSSWTFFLEQGGKPLPGPTPIEPPTIAPLHPQHGGTRDT